MIIMDTTAFSGFARKTTELVSDFAKVARNPIMDIRDRYQPGPYHMRGPARNGAKSSGWPSLIWSRSVAELNSKSLRKLSGPCGIDR
jgi:hypothetical protein